MHARLLSLTLMLIVAADSQAHGNPLFISGNVMTIAWRQEVGRTSADGSPRSSATPIETLPPSGATAKVVRPVAWIVGIRYILLDISMM